MDMKAFQEQLECTGIIPVIKLEDTSKAVQPAAAGSGSVSVQS